MDIINEITKYINNLTAIDITVQILGIITIVIFFVSMQQRKKETFLLLQTAGTILFITQYILTRENATTGAALFSIAVIRGLVFFYFKKKNLKPALAILIIFQTAVLVSTVITWDNALSILPFISATARTWGTWQDDMKWARRTSLLGYSCMIIYNITVAVFTGALTEVFNTTSTLIAIWRYDFHIEKIPAQEKT